MAKSKDKQQNIDSVLQTAYELFLREGIENTTKEMLVRASGISRSSVDRYFENKLDCVLQTAKWISIYVRDAKLPVLASSPCTAPTGIAQLRQYLERVQSLVLEKPQLFVLGMECRIFLYRNSTWYEADCGQLASFLGSSAYVKSILQRGVADGSIRADTDPDSQSVYIRETYLGLLTSMALAHKLDPEALRSGSDRYIAWLLQQLRTDT